MKETFLSPIKGAGLPIVMDAIELRTSFPTLQSSLLREAVPSTRLPSSVLDGVDCLRQDACRPLAPEQRDAFGQFLTPAPVARLMAAMLRHPAPAVSLLDAGAGIGSLLAACVDELCSRETLPQSLHITAYEIDPQLLPYLHETVAVCRKACAQTSIAFSADIRPVDFLQEAADLLEGDLFARSLPAFTAAILNPPYRKIHAQSPERAALRRIGVETSNLYTGFLAAALQMLAPDGELVAITPRSFCNGPYFRPFRQTFLREMALERIHLFDARNEAFRDDAVLQETVIVHARKTRTRLTRVGITTSASAEDAGARSQELPYAEVVHPDDPEQFIRVVADSQGQQVTARIGRFRATLEGLGLRVSTGRVVDFRAKEYLRDGPEGEDTVPLLYPVNLEAGTVVWPRATRKPQALVACKETELLLVPNATYVLVKRFSSKEQARRVTAAVFEGGRLPGTSVGLENHLNYFHQNGAGLEATLATGLATYLNSTLVDAYFRQFSGHTQVNATDLRHLPYPAQDELHRLGAAAGTPDLTQEQIDALMEQEFFP